MEGFFLSSCFNFSCKARFETLHFHFSFCILLIYKSKLYTSLTFLPSAQRGSMDLARLKVFRRPADIIITGVSVIDSGRDDKESALMSSRSGIEFT